MALNVTARSKVIITNTITRHWLRWGQVSNWQNVTSLVSGRAQVRSSFILYKYCIYLAQNTRSLAICFWQVSSSCNTSLTFSGSNVAICCNVARPVSYSEIKQFGSRLNWSYIITVSLWNSMKVNIVSSNHCTLSGHQLLYTDVIHWSMCCNTRDTLTLDVMCIGL